MKKYRILICEDNPADVLLLEKAFKAHALPYSLDVVQDGDAARNILPHLGEPGTSCPDTAIIDLHLPRIEGQELIRVLRENRWCAATPVVVFTSSVSPQDEEPHERSG